MTLSAGRVPSSLVPYLCINPSEKAKVPWGVSVDALILCENSETDNRGTFKNRAFSENRAPPRNLQVAGTLQGLEK